jgi:ornithine cyclodeaminase/alanine dehydrogenase-like protein (mu-crystallin family)
MTVHPAAAAPLRYLSAADIDACLPSVEERLDLAQEALVALAHDQAEMPPKLGVHPRDGALLHAMPAWLRSRDLVGMKWVAAYPRNKARGLAPINGLVILNDAETGLPTWITDAARITAVRTAAVSGVAIRLLGRRDASRVAILGAGTQARSHLEVLAALLPSAEVLVHDRNPERAVAVAGEASSALGLQQVRAVDSVEEAVARTDVVITVATLGAEARRLGPADLAPGTLVVAVDFATYVSPLLAEAATPFTVDDRGQFLRYRELGYFDGYPDPGPVMGELVGRAEESRHRPSDGPPALVTHLGVGLADVVLADAICRRAAGAGAGQELAR